MKPVLFHDEARAELDEAAGWYVMAVAHASRRPGYLRRRRIE